MNAHVSIKQHCKDQVDKSRASAEFRVIASSKPGTDLDMSLSGLDVFVYDIKSRKLEVAPSTFSSTHEYAFSQTTELPTIRQLLSAHEVECFRLATYESWIEHHLTR